MRNDMPKILVGRPRLGHADPNLDVRRGRATEASAHDADAYDALPRRSGMKPRSERKCLNENLAPLRRFLQRRCGRPWDRVYSELRASLSPKSVIDMHILQHLFRYVHLHVAVRKDGIVDLTHRFYTRPQLVRDGRTFYVDPQTGLLCEPHRRWRRPRWRRLAQDNAVPRVAREQGGLYLQLDGIWFAVQLAPAVTDAWDVVRRVRVTHSAVGHVARQLWFGDGELMAVTKRQVGKRELREVRQLMAAEGKRP